MERKTRAAYTAVFQHLRRILGNVAVVGIMADYETAMRSAAVTVFPGTTLKGCWFHYARAVFRKSQQLGLQRPEIRQITRRIIRIAMVLPLLPEGSLAEGVAVLEALATEANVDIATFSQYLRRQWVPLHISVHGHNHRTNNSAEAFHRQLYRLVYVYIFPLLIYVIISFKLLLLFSKIILFKIH